MINVKVECIHKLSNYIVNVYICIFCMSMEYVIFMLMKNKCSIYQQFFSGFFSFQESFCFRQNKLLMGLFLSILFKIHIGRGKNIVIQCWNVNWYFGKFQKFTL